MFQDIHKIKAKLEVDLPGPEAQYLMAPLGRKEMVDIEINYTPAAVLCLIYPKQDARHLVFIQRTAHAKDKHSAQIAFPGGRVEEADKDYVDAALREAEEEIGLVRGNVQVIGELTPLKIPVSGFEVFPVFAYSEKPLTFRRQVTEVDKIIELPLNLILDSNNRQRNEIRLSSGVLLPDVPMFKIQENVIWGATSMILSELIEILT